MYKIIYLKIHVNILFYTYKISKLLNTKTLQINIFILYNKNQTTIYKLNNDVQNNIYQ